MKNNKIKMIIKENIQLQIKLLKDISKKELKIINQVIYFIHQKMLYLNFKKLQDLKVIIINLILMM